MKQKIKDTIINYIIDNHDEDTQNGHTIEVEGYTVGFDFSVYFRDYQENFIDGLLESAWYNTIDISVENVDIYDEGEMTGIKIEDFEITKNK